MVDLGYLLKFMMENKGTLILLFKLNEDQSVENITRTCVASVSEKKWSRPVKGVLKCKFHSVWINPSNMCGGAWIVRDWLEK